MGNYNLEQIIILILEKTTVRLETLTEKQVKKVITERIIRIIEEDTRIIETKREDNTYKNNLIYLRALSSIAPFLFLNDILIYV